MTENYRREYNEIRPHSSLNYAPPAPATKLLNAEILTLYLVQKLGA